MRGKKYIAGALVLAAGVAGFGAFRTWFPAYASTKEKVPLGYAEAQATPPAQSKVNTPQTIRPKISVEDNYLRLTGSLVADQKSEVASTANGVVQEVKVERGSVVKEGDVLVVVDPTDAQNSLNEGLAAAAELRAALGWEDTKQPFDPAQHPNVRAAQASLDLAKTTYDRYTALLAKGAIAQSMFDQARMQYETAQQQHQQALQGARQLYQSLQTVLARVEILEKMLADTTITAPFSGWVAEKYVSEGERVSTNPMGAGAKVISLVKLDPLRLVLTVPQQYAAVVTQGQQVKFTVETFPGKTFSGEVQYVAPSLESHSRSLSVEAVVANPEGELRPGFFAAAELVLPGTTERLMLPTSAVMQSGDISRVYVVSEGVTVERVVEVEESQGDSIYIKSGLTADDAVIAAPNVQAQADEAKS